MGSLTTDPQNDEEQSGDSFRTIYVMANCYMFSRVQTYFIRHFAHHFIFAGDFWDVAHTLKRGAECSLRLAYLPSFA